MPPKRKVEIQNDNELIIKKLKENEGVNKIEKNFKTLQALQQEILK